MRVLGQGVQGWLHMSTNVFSLPACKECTANFGGSFYTVHSILQVHIVNSLRYSSTVIETIRNPGADKPTPAATARTISSDQLPVPSEMALANLTPCLHVPFARAMLIRTANEDWAVLRGALQRSGTACTEQRDHVHAESAG